MKKRISIRAASALTLGLSLALTSCSSAADNKAIEKVDATSECAQDAAALVEKWTAPVELTAPSQEIDMASIQGQEIHLLLTLTNQFSGTVADGFKKAAERAGLTPVVFDGKGTVSEWNKGLNSAISRKPAGIVLWGIPPELVSEGVEKAKEAGIPVIDSVNGSVTDPLQDGIAAHVDVDAQEWGEALGSWFLSTSDCKANVGLVWPPAFGGLDKIAKATIATLEECDECSVKTAEMDVANMATTLPEQARTMLTANPDMNFFTPLFDSAVTYVAPVVQGYDGVQIGSHDGIETSLDMVRSGGPQTMDMTYPPNEYLGWMYVSLLGSLATGQEVDEAMLRIPERMVTTETIPDTNEEIWETFDGYEDVFAEAWGR